LGSVMPVRRPLPVAPVAARPVVGRRAVEQLDEAGGNLPAAVPALVDDQGVLVHLAEELPEQVVLPFGAGVGDVDVPDAPVAGFLHVPGIGGDPVAVAQLRLAAGGGDDY